jgi:hypothetical protein
MRFRLKGLQNNYSYELNHPNVPPSNLVLYKIADKRDKQWHVKLWNGLTGPKCFQNDNKLYPEKQKDTRADWKGLKINTTEILRISLGVQKLDMVDFNHFSNRSLKAADCF